MLACFRMFDCFFVNKAKLLVAQLKLIQVLEMLFVFVDHSVLFSVWAIPNTLFILGEFSENQHRILKKV